MTLEQTLPLRQVIFGDCLEVMNEWPSNFIDLTVTSPPYFNEKDYSQWTTFEEYLSFLDEVFSQISRITKPGHRVCVNIADIFSKLDYEPTALSADLHHILRRYFKYDTTIVWNKTFKHAGKTGWGSFCLPSNPCVQSAHEYILVYRKVGQYILPSQDIKESSIIDKRFFFELIQSVWSFRQETNAKEIGHPAPFPPELPERLLRFYSFINDIVLDPFLGSGTTALEAEKLRRKWIGIEQKPEYCEIAKKRLAPWMNQSRLDSLPLEASSV